MAGESSLRKLRIVSGYAVWIVVFLILIVALCLAVSIIGVIYCYANPYFQVDPMDNKGTIIDFFCNIVVLASCLWCSALGYNTIVSIKDGSSPFVQENVERMKDITITIGATFAALIVLQLILQAILKPELYIFDLPLHLLMMDAVMLVFTLLFEYGTALQTESDEFL